MLLTRPPLRISVNQYSPFDLHVLGVPPAFVLSQDQTLYDNCISYYPFRQFEILFNNAYVISALFLILSLNLFFRFPQKNFKGRYFSSLALFNFQGACQSSADLFIISHLFHFVKYFLKFFSIFFLTFFQDATSVLRRLIYYITCFFICQVFFKTFLKNFFRDTPDASRPTALSLYHTFSLLSSKILLPIFVIFCRF